MKNTQTITKKTISIVLLVVLFSANGAFAQKQNIEAENINPLNNVLLLAAVFLFIVGFTVLFALKLRDDDKSNSNRNKSPHVPARHHPNHYGRRHQFHR